MPASWDFPRTPSASLALVELGEEEGMSAVACLAGTGLRKNDLAERGTMVHAGQELTIVRNLLHHTGNRPGLGVRAGSRVTVGMLGIWGFAMLSSRTTRGVIDIASRFGYGKFSWVFLRPWVDEQPREVHIVYADEEVPADVRVFLTERDLTFSAALLPQLFSRALPTRITTKLDASRATVLRKALPDCALEFEAARNAQILQRAQLDAPLPRADEHAVRICERQCEELVARRSERTGVAAAVRSALVGGPLGGRSLAQIARERSLDPRTLRRQLDSEGTSFRKLQSEVHEALATELLTTTDVTVEQVAERLGYADAPSFSRAYKRWTGSTPGAVAQAGRN